ncbi:MAG: lytic transglycosylase domain-containing protein [Burkholderiaceae bacterium]|jgi:soluble lytic murein transglycosylase-like protein|nr:lytic transglycosylase domain-containing protein [Burkholderiaceae bacterium]
MLQQHQVGALFAVLVRTIGAARFVRAVAPVAALVAVASIPLPRAASSIDVLSVDASLPSSGLVQVIDIAQRAANGAGDTIASTERRKPSTQADVRHRGEARSAPVARIGDRWLQVRAEQRAMQRSGEGSAHHVGDRLLHTASTSAFENWSAASPLEAISLLGDVVKPVASTEAEPRAPPADSTPSKEAARAPQPTVGADLAQGASSLPQGASFFPQGASSLNFVVTAIERDTLSPLKLSTEQRNISRFVARRYRVNLDDVQRFVAHAFRAAGEFRIDPYLVLAVMSIESSFNPNARSSAGAQGLMQVLTRVHLDKFAPFGGARAALDPVANITVGSRILKEYLVREGSVEGALKSYVGAALLPHDFGYGNKVLTERARIAAAARDGAKPPVAAPAATQIAMAEAQPRVAKPVAIENPSASSSRQAYSALRAPTLSEAKAQEEL